MAASSPTEPRRRTVVVTGAASGMGLAVAERFITEGWTVIGIDRDAESLLVNAAAHDPAAFRPAVADIPDRGAVPRALGDISGLEAVVNAAGIYPPTTLADYDSALPAAGERNPALGPREGLGCAHARRRRGGAPHDQPGGEDLVAWLSSRLQQ